MELVLACPNCLIAQAVESVGLARPSPCPFCGALRMLSPAQYPYFRLQCPGCALVYHWMDHQAYAGQRPACPRCGARAGKAVEATEWPD